MGDVFGDGVLRANCTGINAIAFASLGHGVVARVEVFAVLEVLREVVRSGGEFAVEPEEALFLRRERLELNYLLAVDSKYTEGLAGQAQGLLQAMTSCVTWEKHPVAQESGVTMKHGSVGQE